MKCVMNPNDKFELIALFSLIFSQISNGRTSHCLHLSSLASSCAIVHTHTQMLVAAKAVITESIAMP